MTHVIEDELDQYKQAIQQKRVLVWLALTMIIMLVGMSVYEFGKQLLFPNMTILQSHIITIIFSSTTASIAAYLVLCKQLKQTNAQLQKKIVEHKRVEEALRDSKERFRTVADFTYDWEYWLGSDGNYIYVSPSCERITGYPPDEFFSNPGLLETIIYPDDHEIVTEHIHEELENDKAFSIDFRIITRSGKVHWLSHVCQTVYSADRSWLGSRASIRDITERKQMEEMLRESEDRYRRLVELSPDAIVVHQNNRFVYVNKAAIQLFAAPDPKTVIDRSIFEIIHPAYHEIVTERVRKTYEEGKTSALIEEKYVRLDGQEIEVEVAGAPITFCGKPAVQVVIRDITERKRAEEKLRQTMRELERSNAELEQFAYVASHDLQQPLLILDCYVQLLAQRYKGKLDSEADDFIARLIEGVDRMQTMIKELLDYSRLDAKSTDFQRTDCGIVFGKAIANLQASIDRHDVAVTHDPFPIVMAKDFLLVQLFQNLISNAIKFRSEEPPRIHVSVDQQENAWLFSVQDNGIGFDPRYTERIFTLFERIHDHRKYPGTGIGLAICKKIVERHGGSIWGESVPGKGATFYFTIPRTS